MPFGLKRKDLQSIAEAKLHDAQLLLKHKRFANAYYLAGYAVEIGLKACIARQISAETIPDRSFVNNIYSHEFVRLVALAGLTRELKLKQDADQSFSANWSIAAEWKPDLRYESIDPYSSQLYVRAIDEAGSGVLSWIKPFW